MKRDLLDSLERRTGDFETREHYALSTALDPRFVDERIQLNIFNLFSRYFLSSFSKEENRVAARLLLIKRINEYIQKANLDPVVEKRYRGSFDHLKLSCLLKGHP